MIVVHSHYRGHNWPLVVAVRSADLTARLRRRPARVGLVPLLGRSALHPGKGDFYDLGRPREGKNDNPSLGTGAYALDQSWHWAWIFISTIVTVIVP